MFGGPSNLFEGQTDLDYHKLIIDQNSSERVQFVKRNVYLKDCYHQYPIIDESLQTATIKTPQGVEIKQKVYLFPTVCHPRQDAPIRLAPLVDFKNRKFCVRNSYTQSLLLIEPLRYISFNDISENLFYNPDFDKLCNVENETFYREQYPEYFNDDVFSEADQDDVWPYEL